MALIPPAHLLPKSSSLRKGQALGPRGLVTLEKTDKGILVLPGPPPTWDDFFGTKLTFMPTPGNMDEKELKVTGDDIIGHQVTVHGSSPPGGGRPLATCQQTVKLIYSGMSPRKWDARIRALPYPAGQFQQPTASEELAGVGHIDVDLDWVEIAHGAGPPLPSALILRVERLIMNP
jgi:hypothetical protein